MDNRKILDYLMNVHEELVDMTVDCDEQCGNCCLNATEFNKQCFIGIIYRIAEQIYNDVMEVGD